MNKESTENNHEVDKAAFQARLDEWKEVEDLVMQYKKQFEEEATFKDVDIAQEAMEELLKRFTPLFRKYSTLLRSGQINFNDNEMKLFVSSFIDDEPLKKALRRKKQKAFYRREIYARFNFIKETYGAAGEEEIMLDLQIIFMEVAKRYKQMGRSFCGYLYNCFRFEVSRHIKKYIRNPINIPYKHTQFEEYMKFVDEPSFEIDYEDHFYESNMGIPDLHWIAGETCSNLFVGLAPAERKLLIKYYLEDWNDRQIAEEFCIHINTVNQKRRQAIRKVAELVGIDEADIKRNRKSGKKAIMPV